MLPLLKNPPKLTSSHSDLEIATFPTTIKKLIAPLSCSVALERQYKGKIKGENITLDKFLGLGSIETLHGSPDARARGFVMEELDLVSQPHDSDESDGGSVTVDGKRNLAYRRSGHVKCDNFLQLTL